MKKIKKEFKKMNEVVNFLKTIEARNEVKREIEKIVKNIEKTLGYPYAEINHSEYFGNTYKKEFYVSEITQSVNSYDESFQALIRVKNNNIRLIVLIDYFKYDYNYGGDETGESAIIKMAYTD